MRQYLLFFPFLLFSLSLFSQAITSERVIPIRDYDIKEIGYPLQVVGAGEGFFAYLQYWPKGKYHPEENYYVQCLSNSDYSGQWYQPVTEPGFEPMQISSLEALAASHTVVLGQQYLAKAKMLHTVGRFFDPSGEPKSQEPVQISIHPKKAAKTLVEEIYLSPEKECLFWVGLSGNKTYCSAWTSEGQQIWNKSLELPWLSEKYQVSKVSVDEEGNPYFLLQNEKPSYTIKDTLLPPVLVRYDHRSETLLSDTLTIDSAFVAEVEMVQLNQKDLIIAGILSNNDHRGLRNGELAFGEARKWNSVFFKRYRFEDSLYLAADSSSALPEAWREAYTDKGSNFSSFQLLTDKASALLVMEEVYQSKDRLAYYDVGIAAFSLKSGALRWGQTIEKRQRSTRSGAFLSFVPALINGKAHFVYLTELGAPGEIRCTSLSLKDGSRKDHKLASNESTYYLFMPEESGLTDEHTMVLMGMGNPAENDYKVITIRF